MIKYGSYLICKEHVREVKDFLGEFFEEKKDKYNHENWVTFVVPNTDFKINLMKGSDQSITQNMTFEIYCESKEGLEKYAKKHNLEIESFVATETSQPYTYYYIEILGPYNICKIEVNYCEDLKGNTP